MPLQNIPLTKNDFDKSQWDKIVDGSEKKECHSYSTLFFAKAREFEESKDLINQEIFALLGAISSMYLKEGSISGPFGPMYVMGGSRSAIIDDFSDDHLNVLSEVLPSVNDPEIKARVADVIWLRKKDFKVAQIAVESYLTSASRLMSSNHWPQSGQRIERALRISVRLGKKSSSFEKVVEHIEKVLDKYGTNDPLFLSHSLMGLLLEFRQGQPEKFISLSGELATKAESDKIYYRARSYWEIKAKWHKVAGEPENENQSLVNAAETYVKEAELAISRDKPSYMLASSHQQHAIEAYRRIGGNKERLEDLHSTLIGYQEKSMDEMAMISSEGIDLGDAIKESIDRVKGKQLFDALFEFVIMLRSPRVKDLRKQVEETAKKHPMQYLVAAVVVNENGKVVAKHSNMHSDNPEEVEKAIQEHMYKQAAFHHQIYTLSLIEPIRNQLNLDHSFRLQDFLQIVSNNPIVPAGREYIFAQGLELGMEGDYLNAVHLLIPQIENSMRHILTQLGEVPSGIDSKGIQDERSLNLTLYPPYSSSLEKVFGEDIIFDLRGLLVERFGANLRNRMAHGLMDHNSFYSVEVPYLWCLVLKICCLPIIKQIKDKQAESKIGGVPNPEGREE